MEILYKALSEIRPYENNPRVNDKAASAKEMGKTACQQVHHQRKEGKEVSAYRKTKGRD